MVQKSCTSTWDVYLSCRYDIGITYQPPSTWCDFFGLLVVINNRIESTWVFPKIGVTPKSSILIGFSPINRPFWGTPIFGNSHMEVTTSKSQSSRSHHLGPREYAKCLGGGSSSRGERGWRNFSLEKPNQRKSS